MRNSRLCSSAQAFLRQICAFCKRRWKYKRATRGGEATPVCCDSLILGQKGGIQRKVRKSGLLQVQNNEMKAMTATVILNSEEVNFKEFEMRCSLVDTGTGKVLSSDDYNVDSCSAQDSRVTTTTEGTHVLEAKNTGTLTRYVIDVESYVQQIIIVKSLFVDDLFVTGNELVQIENVKQSVATRFALTDEGRLEYYLGGELEYKDQNTLVLHQRGISRNFLNVSGWLIAIQKLHRWMLI